MDKSGIKSVDFEGEEGVKTSNGLEFTGGRPKSGGKPGIYIVRSERVKTVGFVWSQNVEARVRKVKSEYTNGKRQVFLDKMKVRYSGDVVFEIVEECAEEIFGVRLRRLAEEWMGNGYEVYGWTGWKGDSGSQVTREWGPCGRLRELAEKHVMTEEGVMELLDQMDTVLNDQNKA